jgi:hypothetical protein
MLSFKSFIRQLFEELNPEHAAKLLNDPEAFVREPARKTMGL